jgi:hypothetical protein
LAAIFVFALQRLHEGCYADDESGLKTRLSDISDPGAGFVLFMHLGQQFYELREGIQSFVNVLSRH